MWGGRPPAAGSRSTQRFSPPARPLTICTSSSRSTTISSPCLAFRVGTQDAQLLDDVMAPRAMASDIAGLPNHLAVVRSVGGLGNVPFTLRRSMPTWRPRLGRFARWVGQGSRELGENLPGIAVRPSQGARARLRATIRLLGARSSVHSGHSFATLGSMKQGLGLFVLVGVLMAIGAVTLQCRTLRYVQNVSAAVEPAPAPEAGVVSAVPRLISPQAILVLDVSGSMRDSDPLHLQTEAVRQFYRLYSALSREVLGLGEHARIAVVLFSTIAQTIDWTGRGEPWLTVSEENQPAFDRVVARYLGEVGSEPRIGQDTDYLAAISRVDRLASGLTSPPAILFLTDGVYDLHPLFSPLLAQEAKTQWLSGLSGRASMSAQHVMDGERDFLSSQTLPPIFDTREVEAQAMVLPTSLDTEARRAILEARQILRSRQYCAAT